MALLDLIRFVAPAYLFRKPREHWGLLTELLAATVDGLTDMAEEGRLAALPGQVDASVAPNLGGFQSVDALPYIGRDRLVLRGLAESSPAYAARLRRWRDSWALAGTPFGLLEELAGVLTTTGDAPPLLRLVTTNSTWFTREVDGTWRYQEPNGKGFFLAPDGTSGVDSTLAAAWDWDSLALPQPFGYGDDTRFWIVEYCPTNLPYLAATSGTIGDGDTVGEGVGTPDAATIGTVSPEKHVELIRGVVFQRRSAGFRCSHIIQAFDASSFNPDGSSSMYPNGLWGWPCRVIGGVMTPTRDLTARYWRAEPGGIAGT